MSECPARLSCRQAAEFLGVTERQLERWRVERRGPPFFRPQGSRPFYLESDLLIWWQRSRVKTFPQQPSETLRFPPTQQGTLPPSAPATTTEEAPE